MAQHLSLFDAEKDEGREHVPTFIDVAVTRQLTTTTRLTQGLAAMTRPLTRGTVSRDPV